MKKLNITFCSFPDYSGNAKKLYEYMRSKYKTNMNLIWIVYNENSVIRLRKKNINCILIGTQEFRDYISKTDVFFTTQGNLDGDKTDKSVYVELWHGIGPKPIAYLCNNPSEQDIKGYNNIRKIVDYILVPNDFWKVIYSAIFHIEPARIKPLGMPLLEYFKYSDGAKNLQKININTKNYAKTIIFMPTYKKGFNHEDVKNINTSNIFNFPKYDEEKLIKFLEDKNYLLVIKRHPGEQTDYKYVENEHIININDNILFEQDLSINEIINGFDLLITDYSSIGTEFIYLKKPVLYAIDDFEEYTKERGIVFSNYDFWCAGPKVNNINLLIEETDKLLTDKNYYKEEREKAYQLWFKDMPDKSSESICNFLFDGNKLRKGIKPFKHPETILENKIKELEIEENNLKEKSEKEISDLKNELAKKNHEIEAVYSSKSWKIAMFLRKLMGKK